MNFHAILNTRSPFAASAQTVWQCVIGYMVKLACAVAIAQF